MCIRDRTGATAVHPYNDPVVVSGAGTIGLELENQAPGETASIDSIDSVLVACGGGGLAAGLATWFDPSHGDSTTPPTSVVACETETTAGFAEARKAGQPVDVEVSGVAVDALGATSIGAVPFAALQAADAQSVLVNDAAVTAAQQFLWDKLRIVVEPSAAVPVATVLSGRWQPAGGTHTAIVVCGANTGIELS